MSQAFKAQSGNISVRSIYPYSVRAIDEVLGLNNIKYTFRQWKRLTEQEREQYLENPAVRAKMVELAEKDVQFSQYAQGGSY